MTVPTAAESAAVVPAVQAPPTPAIVETPVGQPTSPARPTLDDSLVEQLVTNSKFIEFAEKLVKSKQDRRFANLEREFKALQAGTGDITKVRQAVEALDDNPAPVAPGSATVAAQPETLEARTAARLAALNISLDDPEVAALALEPVASESQWFGKLERLAAQRTARAGIPASAVVADGGSTPAPALNKDQTRQQLTAQLRELQKTPSKLGNAAKMADVSRKLEALVR